MLTMNKKDDECHTFLQGISEHNGSNSDAQPLKATSYKEGEILIEGTELFRKE